MKLFCFGLGYSAETLIRAHGGKFVSISGTVRTQAKAERLKALGVNALVHAGRRARTTDKGRAGRCRPIARLGRA